MSSSEQKTGNTGQEQMPIDFSFVLASSVHDMKNSLGMLLHTLSAMMENSPPKDAEQARFFSTLEYEAARINGELVQLLSLYRMDENTMVVVIDEHHPIDIIEEQIAPCEERDLILNFVKGSKRGLMKGYSGEEDDLVT